MSGIRVVDLTHHLAGPFCTMLLADLGAEVIKVEPPWGDASRIDANWPMVKGWKTYFLFPNRNKKSLILNLKTEKGVEILKKLVKVSDIVVENFRPGVLSKLGIGYDELTVNAKIELENAVEMIVLSREELFVDFFNTAQPITPRMHALELIPGIGKKYMWDILNNREKKPFKNFADLQNRVNIPNPSKLITKRIIKELSSHSKYCLFTRSS